MHTSDDPPQIHVFDLPQIYTRPSPDVLLQTLNDLAIKPISWDVGLHRESLAGATNINEDGIPKYLTSIIASRLAWIDDEDVREQIWELASSRLCERSGRAALPPISRSFSIPTMTDPAGPTVTITLYEPSLTADNLGLKTWASSYLLSKRLAGLSAYCPTSNHSDSASQLDLNRSLPQKSVLELGAGTGLVGISAAAVWGVHVHLTDLPTIVPNLSSNITANAAALSASGGVATSDVLDWSVLPSEQLQPSRKYGIILAADPLYSPEHPRLLVQTITRCLATEISARVVVELPLREAYMAEIEDLNTRMVEAGLRLLVHGEEVGYDDWAGGKGSSGLKEVKCWWGIWGWKDAYV
ncbi:MAG: glucose-inducible SAM-dependent methyltransferase Rrg1 [Lasallia pustulata]|uniref:Glucose-inducible SAM-dependent methyltransferase Rrg1 n=1 Tax=Lasallia pustulata TaxID=136370 RepID=A0A5M8Q2C1_9LECA|nr:MAG: glucose-inducible SAM-dependent methyltransferase Rrg1 [Lasallia pustulata]